MFKWRNHQPDIGRFFNVDPLAEDYYYNSPYAFSENKVVAHVELEGLEKVFFQKALNQNQKFKKIYKVQRRTSSGIRFRSKLKNQNKVNVLYFQFDGMALGASKKITSMSHFKKVKKLNMYGIYDDLSEGAIEIALERGKEVLLIGMDADHIDKGRGNDEYYTLNEEEYHAEKSLDGRKGDDKNEKDHLDYFGDEVTYGPEPNDVKTKKKYRNSMAKKLFEEIDKMIEKDEKKKNNSGNSN